MNKYSLIEQRIFKNFAKAFLQQKIFSRLRFSKTEKVIIVLSIVAILIVSAFGFLIDANNNIPTVKAGSNPTPTPSATQHATSNPTDTPSQQVTIPSTNYIIPVIPPSNQKQPGLIESSQDLNSTVWKAIAINAWKYFEVGKGIDSTTGLPAAHIGWNHFTDWDLGVYIQAIIDAQKIGLIANDSDWGARARLDKVMYFLENRELNSTTKVPFWFYSSDGTGFTPQERIDVIDTGTLFVALYNLKIYDPSFASRVDNFVYNSNHNRTDYASLVPSLKNWNNSTPSIYAYYCVSGFAYFWPNDLASVPDSIIDNMYAGNVTTYNVTLPKADISCEPLLYAYFNQPSNLKIQKLMNETYSAHEAKYNATGQFVAFSEGISPSTFIWEWVVRANGDTWNITDGNTTLDMNPYIYTKVSLSFLSIYNSTFARSMSIYLEKVCPEPAGGYYEGADFPSTTSIDPYTGQTMPDLYSAHVIDGIFCNANGLILAAARYALNA